MHELAKMTDVERQQLIDEFFEDTFGGFDANPDLVAMLYGLRPELPDDPDPDQVHAWVELAQLLSVINGWPTQPSLSPIFGWFTCALNAHPARQTAASSTHD